MEYKMATLDRDFHETFEKANEMMNSNAQQMPQQPPNIESTDISTIFQQQQNMQAQMPQTQIPPPQSSHVRQAIDAIKNKENTCSDLDPHSDMCVTNQQVKENDNISSDADKKNDLLSKIGPLEDVAIIFLIVAVLSSEYTMGHITRMFTFASTDITRSSIIGVLGVVLYSATKLAMS